MKVDKPQNKSSVNIPTLEISNKTIILQRIYSGLYSFIKDAGMITGAVAGVVIYSNPYTAAAASAAFGLIGEKIPDLLMSKPDIILPKIRSYVNNLNELRSSDNFETNLKILHTIAADTSYLRSKDLKRYEGIMLTEGARVSTDLFAMLENRLSDLGGEFADFREKNQVQFGQIARGLRQIQLSTDQSLEAIRGEFGKVFNQILGLDEELMRISRTQLLQLEHMELTHKQLRENSRLLIQYGLKVDASSRALHIQLNHIIRQDAARQKQAVIRQNFASVGSSFAAIEALGRTLDDETIAKIGVVGQIGVKIVENVCALTGGFGMAQVAGLAVLGPISAIAMAGLSLFGLFRRRRRSNGLQQLSLQIQQLGKFLQRGFNQVFENQKIILLTVQRGFQLMMRDFKYPVMNSLEAIEADLKQILLIGMYERREIKLDPLQDLITKSEGVDYDDHPKALKYTNQLGGRLSRDTTSSMLTGQTAWVSSQDSPKMIASKYKFLSKSDVNYAIQFIASEMRSLDMGFPKDDVVIDGLPNMGLWFIAFVEFSRLQRYVKTDRDKLNPTFSTLKKLIVNYQRFINYVRTSDRLQMILVKKCENELAQLQALVNEEFKQIKKDEQKNQEQKNQVTSIYKNLITFKDAMSLNTAFATSLKECFIRFAYWLNLIKLVNSLAGQSMEVSYQKLLDHKLDWMNKSNDGPKWADYPGGYDRPQYYRTLRSLVVNNKIYIFIKTCDYVRGSCYKPDTDQWHPLPDGLLLIDGNGYDKPEYYHTFQCVATTIDGNDYIIQAARCNDGILLLGINLEDETTRAFNKLPLTPKSFKILHVTDNELLVVGISDSNIACHHLNLSTNKITKSSVNDVKLNTVQIPKQFSGYPGYANIFQLDFKYQIGFNAILSQTNDQRELYISYYDIANKHQFLKYDLINGSWQSLPSVNQISTEQNFFGNGKQLPQFNYGRMMFNQSYIIFNQGFTINKGESTMRLLRAVINQKVYFLLAYQNNKGVQLHSFDVENNKWQKLADGPAWMDKINYIGGASQQTTFRAEMVNLQGHPHLVVSIRLTDGVHISGYNLTTNTWMPVIKGPQWLDGSGYSHDRFNSTLRMVALPIRDDHDDLIFLIRDSLKIELQQHKLYFPELSFNQFGFTKALKEQVNNNYIDYESEADSSEEGPSQSFVPLTTNDFIMAQSLEMIERMEDSKFENQAEVRFFENRDNSDNYPAVDQIHELFKEEYEYIKKQMSIIKEVCGIFIEDKGCPLSKRIEKLILKLENIKEHLETYSSDSLKEELLAIIKKLRECDKSLKLIFKDNYNMSNAFYDYLDQAFGFNDFSEKEGLHLSH